MPARSKDEEGDDAWSGSSTPLQYLIDYAWFACTVVYTYMINGSNNTFGYINIVMVFMDIVKLM
jgi:hypothetical protein